MCRKTFEGAMHGTKVYSARMGLKGLALKKFPDIKNNNNNLIN
jgi:hypothetical protein